MKQYFLGLTESARCQLRDWVFIYGRPAVAYVYALLARVLFLAGRERSATQNLLRASRYTDGRAFIALIRSYLPEIASISPALLASPAPLEKFEDRCLVLAEPVLHEGRVRRKGVLLVSFTETSGYLYQGVDRNKLARLFHLVLEPSWSGYADPAIMCWLNWPEAVIVQSSEPNDRKFIEQISSNLVPGSYGAGDWIDPEQFAPCEAEEGERNDLLAVTNYGWWKRNHAFARVVRDAVRKDPQFRATLVLASLGKSVAAQRRLHALIRYYGIEDNLVVSGGRSRADLRKLYASSDALFMASLKEGSSRVIYEAMLMDCPVIVLRQNVGVNKDHINDHTGYFLDEADIGEIFISRRLRTKRTPRKWFLENLGPENTTSKLLSDLKAVFPEEDWRAGDLAIKGNIPEARWIDSTIQLRPLSWWLENV